LFEQLISQYTLRATVLFDWHVVMTEYIISNLSRCPCTGSGTLPTKYQYTGQLSQMDEIGLLYFTARWYDPVLGRWAQPDIIVPVAAQGIQAFDRYAFVNNCPLRYTDPSGHALKDDNSDCAICPPTPKVYPNAEKSKKDYFMHKANRALSTYGGNNDLKAMVQIVNAAASVYPSYKEMMPILTEVFVGKPYSTYSVIYDAGFHGNCNAMVDQIARGQQKRLAIKVFILISKTLTINCTIIGLMSRHLLLQTLIIHSVPYWGYQ
jgi:RHS repeat-associated protein